MPNTAQEMALTVAVVGQHHFRQLHVVGLEVRNPEDPIILTSPPAGRNSSREVRVSPAEFFGLAGHKRIIFFRTINHENST